MLHLWKKIFKKLSKSINYWKAREHCHYTEIYRGAAYNTCTLKFNVPDEIPAVFHKKSFYH